MTGADLRLEQPGLERIGALGHHQLARLQTGLHDDAAVGTLAKLHGACLEAPGLLDKHIRQALDKLPSQQRTVFVLRFYQDMTLKEIGKVMKLSEGTVKSHLFRTIRKLREYLKFYEADFGLE